MGKGRGAQAKSSAREWLALTHYRCKADKPELHVVWRNQLEIDLTANKNSFTAMLEIHRDPVTDDGLHLAETPVRPRPQAHDRANLKSVYHGLDIGRLRRKDQHDGR